MEDKYKQLELLINKINEGRSEYNCLVANIYNNSISIENIEFDEFFIKNGNVVELHNAGFGINTFSFCLDKLIDIIYTSNNRATIKLLNCNINIAFDKE